MTKKYFIKIVALLILQAFLLTECGPGTAYACLPSKTVGRQALRPANLAQGNGIGDISADLGGKAAAGDKIQDIAKVFGLKAPQHIEEREDNFVLEDVWWLPSIKQAVLAYKVSHFSGDVIMVVDKPGKRNIFAEGNEKHTDYGNYEVVTTLERARELAAAATGASQGQAAGSPIIPFSVVSRSASELEKELQAALNAINDPTNVIVTDIRATYSDQSPEFVRMQIQRRLDVVRNFIKKFDDGQIALVRAPGRINLDGEHIDNQDAAVLPIAIDKDILIAFRPTDDGSVVLHNMDESFYQDAEGMANLTPFNANEVHKIYVVMEPDFDGTMVEKAPDNIRGRTYTYVMGVAKGLWQIMNSDIKGAQMFIDGRVEYGGIPQKAGVSSSSALTVASALVLASVNDFIAGPVRMAELTCEWERYQTGGGMMDQFTSLIGGVVFLDCKKDKLAAKTDPEKAFYYERLALPKGYTLVAMNTKTPSAQVDSQYNERRSCTEIGTRVLLSMLAANHPTLADRITDQNRPDAIRRIRDLTPENLGISKEDIDEIFDSLLEEATREELLLRYGGLRDYVEPDANAKLATSLEREFDSRKTDLPYKLRIRCAYQREEYQRVLRATAALKKALELETEGSPDSEIAEAMEEFAKAINESQLAAENDYEISCDQLNIITRLALKNGAICSRLSGKGWGGVAFAILPPAADVAKFMQNVIEGYKVQTGEQLEAPITLTPGVDVFKSGTSRGASVEDYRLAEAAAGGTEVIEIKIFNLSRLGELCRAGQIEIIYFPTLNNTSVQVVLEGAKLSSKTFSAIMRKMTQVAASSDDDRTAIMFVDKDRKLARVVPSSAEGRTLIESMLREADGASASASGAKAEREAFEQAKENSQFRQASVPGESGLGHILSVKMTAETGVGILGSRIAGMPAMLLVETNEEKGKLTNEDEGGVSEDMVVSYEETLSGTYNEAIQMAVERLIAKFGKPEWDITYHRMADEPKFENPQFIDTLGITIKIKMHDNPISEEVLSRLRDIIYEFITGMGAVGLGEIDEEGRTAYDRALALVRAL